MGTASDGAAVGPPVDYIPATTTQSKRLALLYGPLKWWKPPLSYGVAYPGRFDADRMALTLRLLARRHSGLRVCFLPGQPIDMAACVPAEHASWPMRVLDAGPDDASGELAEAYTWLQRAFDPYERPLLRALLVRRAEGDLLGLTIDHSLFDGYSARVLLEDLAHVYDGLAGRPATDFDVAQSDAVAFARDERRWLAGPAAATALAWWDRYNAGLGPYPYLDVPVAAPREQEAPCAFAHVALDADEVSRIRRHCAELRLSAFMLAAAATCVTLREYRSDDDVAFLFASFRRIWPSTSRLIAYVSNRSMMRVATTREDTVASLARPVRAATVEALRHGMLSHEEYLRRRFPQVYDLQPTIANLHLNVMERRALPTIGGLPCTTVGLPSPPGYQLPGIGIDIALHPDGTGELQASYPAGMYDPGLVAELVGAVGRHCVTGR